MRTMNVKPFRLRIPGITRLTRATELKNLVLLGGLWILFVSCVTPSRPEFPVQQPMSQEYEDYLSQAIPITQWGFDPLDSTEYIQAAFDSDIPVLLFPSEPGVWISDQLELPSNKIILFEPGAVLEAKRGAFPEPADMLLKGSWTENLSLIGYGAEVRMWKEDYQNPPYSPAEWRMAIGLYNGSNILIEGLTISSSGGDGVYLGAIKDDQRSWNENITLKNLHIRDHHRQGISVISANGLLIDSVLIEGTRGTPPAAGIDFEPNWPHERLTNILVKDSLIRNNAGPGILVHLQFLNHESEPTDIRVENTIVEGNFFNLSVMGIHQRPRGQIEIVDSTVPSPHFLLRSRDFRVLHDF